MKNHQLVEEWFIEYSEAIYNYLVYYTGSREMEDLVQEVFIKAIKMKHKEHIDNPKTWLFSIARNVAIDHYRRLRIIKWVPEQILLKISSLEKTPVEIALQNEEAASVHHALQQLKPTYRDVMILRWIQDLSVEETAEILGWTESKVKTTYYRAFQKLKEVLHTKFEVMKHEIELRL